MTWGQHEDVGCFGSRSLSWVGMCVRAW